MMSNAGFSSINGFIQDPNQNPNSSNPSKRKRNLPGTPDPNSEVIALSPKSLMATNRFFCEICNKGFQREQNLQLHRRGHNLPWKLKQKTNKEIVKRKVYICPEKTCVHNDPSRALGDLTGIKKHYSRKHGEKKWKCDKCSKKYAVHSDWKAHAKICGTREYKCDCGTIFSRKDSFITHRAFCDALAEENSRFRAPVPSANLNLGNGLMINGGINNLQNSGSSHFSNMFKPEVLGGLESENQLNLDMQKSRIPLWLEYNPNSHPNNNPIGNPTSSYAHLLASSSNSLPEMMHEMAAASQNQWFDRGLKEEEEKEGNRGNLYEINNSSALMSATSLLQKAAQMGSIRSSSSEIFGNSFGGLMGSFPHMGSFSSNFNQGSRNELMFHHNLGKSDHNLNELMASTSASTLTNNGDHHGLLFSDNINSNPLMGSSRNSNPLIVMPNDNQSSGIRAENSSLTRDFLGMGGNENRQFLQGNALANFGSIDSAMNLSRYSRIN